MRILLVLAAALAPRVSLAAPEASPNEAVMRSEAERTVTSILCGEAGRDESLTFAVAGVIENRAVRWRAGGPRWRRVLSIVTEPLQFNARCDGPQESKIQPYHRQAAKLILDPDGSPGRLWLPSWFRKNTLHFSDKKSIWMCSGLLKSGTVVEKTVWKHGKRVKVRQKVKAKRCSPIWSMRNYDGMIDGVMFFHRGEQ